MKNMGKVILGVTISLDGFAEDGDGSVGPGDERRDGIQHGGAYGSLDALSWHPI